MQVLPYILVTGTGHEDSKHILAIGVGEVELEVLLVVEVVHIGSDPAIGTLELDAC